MADGICMENTRTYSFVRVLTGLALNVFLPVRYIGKEKLTVKPPYILISNHVHALDPAVLAYITPREQCFFLGKKELGKHRPIRAFMNRMHVILVDRHHTDMEAMRTCMKVLKNGRILIIFPEGTRHHEGQMEHIENGTAMIALRGKVPLIPVYIDRPLHLFRRVTARIGGPIPTEDLAAAGINSGTCEQLNERMRETFRAMIAGAEEEKKKK